jgi:hypothetical protein
VLQKPARHITWVIAIISMLVVGVAQAAPDLSGVWEVSFGGRVRGAGGGPDQPSLTPEYAQKLAVFKAAQAKGEDEDTPQANCVPPGMPAIMTQPYPMELLFTPGKLTIVIEAYSQTRRIFMELATTIDDAKALTKPYATTIVLKRHRDWDIAEYICEQNNRNLSNEKGKAGIILNH